MKKIQILDGTILKLIAMVCMVFDHVGDNFFPDQMWMRAIGRMALPIFAFCIVEGFIHTRDEMKYLKRLLLFGLISEIPFDLVVSGKVFDLQHQNVMFTFALAVTGLILYRKINDGSILRRICGIVLLLLLMILAVVLALDNHMLALALIDTFYLFKDNELWLRNLIGMIVFLFFHSVGYYRFGLLGFIPLFMYNGQRGKGFKWFFYLFYPGHLLLIYIVRLLLK